MTREQIARDSAMWQETFDRATMPVLKRTAAAELEKLESKLLEIEEAEKAAAAKERSANGFFAIDRRIWSSLCDLQKNNLAVAYLVMAMGSSGGNTRTKWSAEAIHQHSGMSWRDAKLAIGVLIAEGFVRLDPEAPRSRPRYILPSFGERDRQSRRDKAGNPTSLTGLLDKSTWTAAERSKLHTAGYTRGEGSKLEWWPENEVTPDADRIWLPNTLVLGAPGWEGPAPIRQFFQMGDVWTFRLLVDLYHVHYLDSHQGIDRAIIYNTYTAKKLGQQGQFNVWGFARGNGSFMSPEGSPFFAQKRGRKQEEAAGQHPAWDSMNKLEQMGLVSSIPHFFANGNPETKPLHGLGGTWQRAEPEEHAVRVAAIAAGREMLQEGQLDQAEALDMKLIIPAPHYLTPAVWGIYRMRFRPHTSATTRWYEQIKRESPGWVKTYERLKEQAERAAPALTEWESWGT